MAGLVTWALRADRRAKLEPTWRTVTGLVSRSEVISGKTTKPKIVYSYTVDGRDYVGKRVISNRVTSSGAKSPRQLCDRFPVGSHPTVYVDPENPRRAVLVPGGDRVFLVFVLGMAAFFLLMGIVMVGIMVGGSPK